MILLLIAGTPLTMILAATWLWYFVVNGELDLIGAVGTANSGTLLQPPRQIEDMSLRQGQQAFTYADLEPRWALLIPWLGENCDATCANTLYVTRQIHVAIGKDFNRIRRVFVGTAPPAQMALAPDALQSEAPTITAFDDLLETEHRGIQTLQLSAADFGQIFAEWVDDPTTWYLVDPRGWVMMSYNSEISYKDVISDLKFLLKNSSS